MKTLALDFDGVLHAYTTPWTHAGEIADKPVPGAAEFLAKATKRFKVVIVSSRLRENEGRQAMLQWFLDHFDRDLVNELTFDDKRPPAHVCLDDRALTFSGEWPSLDVIEAFRPWNRTEDRL